jgi:hypothetical protein
MSYPYASPVELQTECIYYKPSWRRRASGPAGQSSNGEPICCWAKYMRRIHRPVPYNVSSYTPSAGVGDEIKAASKEAWEDSVAAPQAGYMLAKI